MRRYFITILLLVAGAALALGQHGAQVILSPMPVAGGSGAAPSLISFTQSANWSTTGSTKTAVITWATGDLVVVIAGSENNGDTQARITITTPPTGLAALGSNIKGSFGTNIAESDVWAAAATAPGTSVTLTLNDSTTSYVWGFGVWVWRSATPGAGNWSVTPIGNSVEQHTGGSAGTESVSLTPTAAHGAIVWGTFDYNTSALGTIVPTPTNTRQRAVIGSNYTIYVADLIDQAGTGGVLYGISGAGSTTGPFSTVALEIKHQ